MGLGAPTSRCSCKTLSVPCTTRNRWSRVIFHLHSTQLPDRYAVPSHASNLITVSAGGRRPQALPGGLQKVQFLCFWSALCLCNRTERLAIATAPSTRFKNKIRTDGEVGKFLLWSQIGMRRTCCPPHGQQCWAAMGQGVESKKGGKKVACSR